MISINEFIQADISKPVVIDFSDKVVAGMATMPSRSRTFRLAFESIIRQVGHLHLYLDGHLEAPEFVSNHPKVTTYFSKDIPGLRANGKLLGLSREVKDCLYVCVDDDIYFPFDFVSRMRRSLSTYFDEAVVGPHGTILARPLIRYYDNRRASHYAELLKVDVIVDCLGTGAVMFRKSKFEIDLASWPQVSMVDLGLAIAATRHKIPMVCVAREKPLVITLGQNQLDSLFRARVKDDSFQTELGKRLIELKMQNARDKGCSPNTQG